LIEIEKEYIGWDQVEEFIRDLSGELLNFNSHIKGIYAVPRGGLVLGVMLSHITKLPMLAAPCKDCIIIDDISDTGKTLEVFREKNYLIATLMYHKQTTVIPEIYKLEKKDNWIVFPWEIEGEE